MTYLKAGYSGPGQDRMTACLHFVGIISGTLHTDFALTVPEK
jgi:hypothetical protein